MAIERKDEILTAMPGDSSVIPRWNIYKEDGTLLASNVQLQLQNTVAQKGMPYSATVVNEILAASGTTTGTAAALTLAQPSYILTDGARVMLKLHVSPTVGCTLNINGTGAKPLQASGSIGDWLEVVYNVSNGSYVGTSSGGLPEYTHTRVGTVNQLSGPAGAKVFQVLLTASVLSGDTWTLNGAPVTAATTTGVAPDSGTLNLNVRYLVALSNSGNPRFMGTYNVTSNAGDGNTQNVASAALANSKMPISGGTFTGAVKAQHSAYTGLLLRNIEVDNISYQAQPSIFIRCVRE